MRRRRSSLIVTFSAVSLLAMVVLGVGLVVACTSLLREQALNDGARTAETYVRLKLDADRSVLNAFRGDHQLAYDDPGLVALAEQMGLQPDANPKQGLQAGPGQPLLGLRLWNDSGELLWDTRTAAAGFADTARLDQVLNDDRSAAAVTHELTVGAASRPAAPLGSGGAAGASPGITDAPVTTQEIHNRAVLDVYVPVTDATGQRVGVAEVELDYRATEAALVHSVRIVALVVVAGLALLWLLLFRTVWNASRTLRRQAAETARLALLDPLTGLPNRRLLNERLERAAAASARSGDSVGLILLDIDRFKEVNDTLGHPRGDALLVEVARRLKEVVRDTDTVARLGGDEFAILLPATHGVAETAAIAGRVQDVFSQPFDLDGLVLHVDTSVGYAALPEHAADITSLLQRADVAMYTAKSMRAGPEVYTPAGDLNSPNRLVLLGDLRRALDDNDQLCMYYQPKVDLATGRVCGLEALLRWRHPLRGLVPPGEFIPLAEQTGLVASLTQRVLRLVAEQVAAWAAEGQTLPVAVNLSARNLAETDLAVFVRDLLVEYRLDARMLEFEITESAIVEDPERARDMLLRLTALGIDVAVDDFGIGNTSMSQLRSMPLSTLKIDRSFVADLARDEGGAVLVKAIIDLAHEFNLVAVAEGVEEPAVTERLRSLGCDVGQGFLWSRAVSASELPAVLELIDQRAAPQRRQRAKGSSVRSGA
ncbi:MAG TPA: EAL domain-containing protein [Actinomycetes bacterium]|nr:EAL domain-containing protein [Actinomycetes bacterium]